jgi:radical SAM protein with 4Fe4S-binding SPASM domain
MIAVDYKGDIYPCVRYMESSLGPNIPPLIIGNIKDGIAPTDVCQTCITALKAVDRMSQSTDECINCRIAEGCAWCQAYNYQDSGGDFNKRATYICIMHQARALANSYYYNRIFLQTD